MSSQKPSHAGGPVVTPSRKVHIQCQPSHRTGMLICSLELWCTIKAIDRVTVNSWRYPGTLSPKAAYLTVPLFLCSSVSNEWGGSEGPWRALCLKRRPSRVQDRDDSSCWKEQNIKISNRKGLFDFYFIWLLKTSPIVWACLLTLPQCSPIPYLMCSPQVTKMVTSLLWPKTDTRFKHIRYSSTFNKGWIFLH